MSSKLLCLLFLSCTIFLVSGINLGERRLSENNTDQMITFDINVDCPIRPFCFKFLIFDRDWISRTPFRTHSYPHLCTNQPMSGMSIQLFQKRGDTGHHTKITVSHNCTSSKEIYTAHHLLRSGEGADEVNYFPEYSFLFKLHDLGEPCHAPCSILADKFRTGGYNFDDSPELASVQRGLGQITNETVVYEKKKQD